MIFSLQIFLVFIQDGGLLSNISTYIYRGFTIKLPMFHREIPMYVGCFPSPIRGHQGSFSLAK